MTETEQTELAALRELEKAREGAMEYMEWSKVVEGVRPHVVRIMTLARRFCFDQLTERSSQTTPRTRLESSSQSVISRYSLGPGGRA